MFARFSRPASIDARFSIDDHFDGFGGERGGALFPFLRLSRSSEREKRNQPHMVERKKTRPFREKKLFKKNSNFILSRTPQGHLVHSLHTQHSPEQLAILNTPYQQFPLRRAGEKKRERMGLLSLLIISIFPESEPDIHEDVKGKIRSKVSERRNNNSPIPRKQGGGVGDRGGSLKRKQSSNSRAEKQYEENTRLFFLPQWKFPLSLEEAIALRSTSRRRLRRAFRLTKRQSAAAAAAERCGYTKKTR